MTSLRFVGDLSLWLGLLLGSTVESYVVEFLTL